MNPLQPWTLTVRNFRCLDEASWSPPPGVSVLIGPNGGGKTTLLHAAAFLSRVVRGRLQETVAAFGGPALFPSRHPEIQTDPVVFELRTGGLRWELTLPIQDGSLDLHGEVLEVDGKPRFVRRMLQRRWLRAEGEQDADPNGVSLIAWLGRPLEHGMALGELEPLLGPLQSFVLYRGFRLERSTQPQLSSDVDIALSADGSNLVSVLHSWQSAPRLFEDRFAWVVEGLQHAFPNQVETLEFERRGQHIAASLYPPGSSRSGRLPLSAASDGLLRGLLLLTAIAGVERGGFAALEGFEDELHPFAIRRILSFARQHTLASPCRLVFTTHSPVLLNALADAPERVLVLLGDGRGPRPLPDLSVSEPGWAAGFSLGDLYDRQQIASPLQARAAPVVDDDPD